MSDWWEATADGYLNHVPKSMIAGAVAEAVSAEEAAILSKLKKPEAIARAEGLLKGAGCRRFCAPRLNSTRRASRAPRDAQPLRQEWCPLRQIAARTAVETDGGGQLSAVKMPLHEK